MRSYLWELDAPSVSIQKFLRMSSAANAADPVNTWHRRRTGQLGGPQSRAMTLSILTQRLSVRDAGLQELMQGAIMRRPLIVGAIVVSCASCAAPAEVTQIGPNRFSVNVGAMGIEGGEAQARNKALQAAADYCNGQGTQMQLIGLQSKGPVEWGSAAGSATATFECLSHK